MSVAASTGTPAAGLPSFYRIGGDPLRFSPDDGSACEDLRLVVGGETDRQQILAHLLRLSDADRRMRFMRVMLKDCRDLARLRPTAEQAADRRAMRHLAH